MKGKGWRVRKRIRMMVSEGEWEKKKGESTRTTMEGRSE